MSDWSDDTDWSDFEEIEDKSEDKITEYIIISNTLIMPSYVSITYDEYDITMNVELSNLFSKSQIEYYELSYSDNTMIKIYQYKDNPYVCILNTNEALKIVNNKLSVFRNVITYDNFLLDVLKFIKCEIRNLNDNCIICNKTLTVSSYKPYICTSDLCYFAYQTHSLLGKIKKTPKRIDLLISLFYVACNSIHPVEYMLPGCDKKSACEILDLVMSVDEMSTYDTNKLLKKALENIHNKAYELISYIINSSALYIKYDIALSKQKGREIFKVITSKTKEDNFNRLARKNKTETKIKIKNRIINNLYHGSDIRNFHNIIRSGLKNFSHTPMMKNGAAYGHGIYISNVFTTSNMYTNICDKVWKNSMVIRKTSRIILELDIITQGDNDWRGRNPHYVVDDASYVNIKYLIIYDHSMYKKP